jgi:hypothetical protein
MPPLPPLRLLIVAMCRISGRLCAAIEVNVLDPGTTLGLELVVSPKHHSPDEKLKRWKEIWFPEVAIADQVA